MSNTLSAAPLQPRPRFFPFLAALRWLGLLAAGAIVVSQQLADDSGGPWPWIWLIALTQTILVTGWPKAVSAWYYQSIEQLLRGRVNTAFVIGLLDVVIALALIQLSGRWESPYYLYAVSALLMPAAVIGVRGILILITLFVGGYLLSISIQDGTLREPWEEVDRQQFVAFLAIPLPIAVLVYLLSWTSQSLASQEAESRRLLEENVALQREREEMAVEHERSRIAREIHDGMAQSMYMLSLNLEAAAKSTEPGSDLGDRLQQLVGLAKGMLLEVRQYIFDLRPLLMNREGVASALRKQAREFSTISSIPVRIEVTGTEVTLPMTHNAALYRVTQEALGNIYRHARASNVSLNLEYRPDRVILRISDDGIGFDPDSSDRRGLTYMTERIEELGGEMALTTAPAQGSLLTASIPLNGPAGD